MVILSKTRRLLLEMGAMLKSLSLRFVTGLVVLLLSLPSLAKPWVVAHRGGPSLGPENRLETFSKAAALGVDFVELDIHQTLDGALMVIHDDTLQRTFGREGKVQELTLQELREIGVPTLQDVIDEIAGRCRIIVEIKHPKQSRHQGIEQNLVSLLSAQKLLDSAIVISFDADSVRVVKELEPGLKTGLLFGGQERVSVEKIKRDLGVDYLGPHYRLATPELVREAHDLGLKVNAWTVNSEEEVKFCLRSGVDAVTTDFPDRVLQLVSEAEPEPES